MTHTGGAVLQAPYPAAAIGHGPGNIGEGVPRFTLEKVSTPHPLAEIDLHGKGLFILTDDESGVSAALAAEIKDRGGRAVILKSRPDASDPDGFYCADLTDPGGLNYVLDGIRGHLGPISGLIHLKPLRGPTLFEEMDLKGWRDRLKSDVKGLYCLARALSADLRAAGGKDGAWFISASTLTDGFEGDIDKEDFFAGHGGIAGFLKSIAQEWPEVICKTIQLSTRSGVEVLAGHISREIRARGRDVVVEYRGSRRSVYRARMSPLDDTGETLRIGKDWVILVTGGAQGITAQAALEIASRYAPTMILAGRSALPGPEPAELSGLADGREIKQALIGMLKSGGGAVTPAAVESAYQRLLKDRDIAGNMDALKKTGAKIEYVQADVRDGKGFKKIIDDIYRTYGRLDGVVHGAGIIEDRLVEDKSPESFDRVFDTKADSAFILSRSLRADSLRFIVFFTSVAGSFGNRGQSDYAAANELVNKLALYMDKKINGRVVAMNWGPWKKVGMVTQEVERQFKERGIQLIPPAAGIASFERELVCGRKGDVEVVFGDGPWKI